MLCKEERTLKEVYNFSILRSNYIITTQIEFCLQESLIEASLLSFEARFQLLGENSEKFAKKECKVNFLAFIREYFRFLLPWLKMKNGLLRSHMTNLVKYFACFSSEFVSIYYCDNLNKTAKEMSIRTRNLKVSYNPNLAYKDSKILSDIRKEMFESFRGMRNFSELSEIFMYLEFDPTSRE